MDSPDCDRCNRSSGGELKPVEVVAVLAAQTPEQKTYESKMLCKACRDEMAELFPHWLKERL